MMNPHDAGSRHILTALEAIRDKEPGTIRADVADYALNYHADDPARFFEDLSRHGCASGMIDHLIYYVDTHTWFDRYYDEIEDLREGCEDSLGEPLCIRGDLKNWLAWFAFEETAFRIARDDLELEL